MKKNDENLVSRLVAMNYKRFVDDTKEYHDEYSHINQVLYEVFRRHLCNLLLDAKIQMFNNNEKAFNELLEFFLNKVKETLDEQK